MSNENVKRIVIPYIPRTYQIELHKQLPLKRFSVVVAHRRFGKTVAMVNHLIMSALKCRLNNPRYAYIAPTYKQAKQIAWDYLKFYAQDIPGIRFNESELYAQFPNGARIRLYGGDSPDSLRGIYLDGVVFDETAQIPQSLWQAVVRPMLSDKGREGWAIFMGTPNGQDHFYDLYQQAKANANVWNCVMYKASNTDAISPTELVQLKSEMHQNVYDQEYECSFTAAIKGAYYTTHVDLALEEGRMTFIPYDPYKPVVTAWDLGIADATAIWIVQPGQFGMWHVIDYIEDTGKSLVQYFADLKHRGYHKFSAILPHDAKQRSIASGLTRIEVFMQHGVRVHICPKLPVEDGITAVQQMLSKCLFNEVQTREGLHALRNYHAKIERKDGLIRNVPEHDWSSHAADAFRYFALGHNFIDLYSENKKNLDTRNQGFDSFIHLNNI